MPLRANREVKDADVAAFRRAVATVHHLLPVVFFDVPWMGSIKYHAFQHLADDLETFRTVQLQSTERFEAAHTRFCVAMEGSTNRHDLHAAVHADVTLKRALSAAVADLAAGDVVALLHPSLRPRRADEHACMGAVTHTDTRFALDVVEVTRQYVVQHCDRRLRPGPVALLQLLHHEASRQPHHHSHVTILPRRPRDGLCRHSGG